VCVCVCVCGCVCVCVCMCVCVCIRTFLGLYPEWDSEHPIHLVAHSMGGLTARCLVQLLAGIYHKYIYICIYIYVYM